MLDGAHARRWHIAGFVAAVAAGAAIVSPMVVAAALDRTGAAAHGLGEALSRAGSGDPRTSTSNADLDRSTSNADLDRSTSNADLDRSTSTSNADLDRRARPSTSAATGAKPRGLLIRERAVLAAVGRGARPSAQVVAATAELPGGLRLSGVPAPFREGDILVSVGGTAARSEDAVVSAVLGAVKSGAKTITGEILRRAAGPSETPGALERIPFAIEVPARFWKARVHAKKHPAEKHPAEK